MFLFLVVLLDLVEEVVLPDVLHVDAVIVRIELFLLFFLTVTEHGVSQALIIFLLSSRLEQLASSDVFVFSS